MFLVNTEYDGFIKTVCLIQIVCEVFGNSFGSFLEGDYSLKVLCAVLTIGNFSIIAVQFSL